MTRAWWIGILVAAAVSAAAAVGFARELVSSDFMQGKVAANYITVLLAIVLGTLVVGVMTARRQPMVGALLVASAAGTAFGYWRFDVRPWPAAIGFGIALCTPLFALHAAVIHGGGVRAPVRRVLIGFEVVVALVGLGVLFTAIGTAAIDRWFTARVIPRFVVNPAMIVDARSFANGAYRAWWFLVIAAGVAFSAARIRSWSREPVVERRADAPVVWAMVAWTIAMGFGGAMLFVHRRSDARQALTDFGAIIVPALGTALIAAAIAWVELVRPRLGRVHAGEIEMSSIEPQDARALRTLLADLLATRRVDVVFATGGGWVDDAGRPATLPADARRVTIVARAHEPVAAVVHEPEVPVEAVELASRLVAAQLDAQRATALARARTEAVRTATGRLVRAGDRAAAEVGAELGAGPLAELDALLARVRTDPAAVADAAGVLRHVTAEVRTISHGVFPRDIDRGLDAVLTVPGTPTRRLPETVEMTVYLLAEHDGAVIHDEGATITVTRSTPVPEAFVERIGALGGQIDGTVVRLPVES